MNAAIGNQKNEEKSPTIRQLYPGLSDEQLREAEINLLRYFEIALDIYEEQSAPAVDTSSSFPKMKERSKETLKT
jgi:hypothetical protein